VKIKLIISEVTNSTIRKNFRKLISPILSKLEILPEFGMFHTAIVVGPWLIEWNNSALCIPRKCVSKAALLTADVDSISTEKKLEEVIDILADCVCNWNTSKQYNDNAKNKSEGNCQDFVQDILQHLGIKPDFQGSLGLYLKKMRENGKGEMEFEMQDDFREKFQIHYRVVIFQSHAALDEFVHRLITIDYDFHINHRNDWLLLKSFDRAFWLRHFKFNRDKFNKDHITIEKYCPLKKNLKNSHNTNSSSGVTIEKIENVKETNSLVSENKLNSTTNEVLLHSCPFDDPETSYSIRILNDR